MGLFDTNTAPLTQGYNKATGAVDKHGRAAQKILKGGLYNARGDLNEVKPDWENLINIGQGGVGQADKLNAFGDPNDFYNTLDYKISREGAHAGLESLARFANARGMLESGNMSQDAMRYMSQFDADTLERARGSFAPYWDMLKYGTAGRSGIAQSLADAELGTATNRANAKMMQGQTLAGLHSGYGTAMTNVGMYDNANNMNFWGNLASGGMSAVAPGFGAGGMFTKLV